MAHKWAAEYFAVVSAQAQPCRYADIRACGWYAPRTPGKQGFPMAIPAVPVTDPGPLLAELGALILGLQHRIVT